MTEGNDDDGGIETRKGTPVGDHGLTAFQQWLEDYCNAERDPQVDDGRVDLMDLARQYGFDGEFTDVETAWFRNKRVWPDERTQQIAKLFITCSELGVPMWIDFPHSGKKNDPAVFTQVVIGMAGE